MSKKTLFLKSQKLDKYKESLDVRKIAIDTRFKTLVKQRVKEEAKLENKKQVFYWVIAAIIVLIVIIIFNFVNF